MHAIGRTKDSLAAIHKALLISPGNLDALKLKKRVHSDVKDFAGVVKACGEILAVDKRDVETYRDMGLAYQALGMNEEALMAFDGAIAVDSMDKRGWNCRGDLLLRLGKTHDALECFEHVLTLSPRDRFALSRRGDVYLDLHDYETALKCFDDGLLLDSMNPDFLTGRARTLIATGKYDDAVKTLTPLLENDPENQSAVKVKAEALLRLGKYEEALIHFERASSVEPDSSALWRGQGEALLALKKDKDAVPSFERAVTLNPRDVSAWRMKAEAHVRLSDFTSAIAAYNQAIAIDGKDKNLRYSLGFALERRGDFEGALAAYDAALDIDSQDKTLWNGRAIALMSLRRYDEAAKSFDLALRLDPEYAPAIEGKKTATERAHLQQIEAFANVVMEFEKANRRPATKEEIFRECRVPFEILDEVVSYVKEPALVDLEKLAPMQQKRYEQLSGAVLSFAPSTTGVQLVDIATAMPECSLTDAREVLGYIRSVESVQMEPSQVQGNDEMVRRALNLPKEEWTLVGLAKNFRIGAMEAKRLETSLRIFRGVPIEKVKPQPELRPPPRPGAPPKPPEPEKASEEEKVRRCSPHRAQSVIAHSCGAQLCRACILEDNCPNCGKPLREDENLQQLMKHRSDDKPAAKDFTRL